jgi:hypothetical protein
VLPHARGYLCWNWFTPSTKGRIRAMQVGGYEQDKEKYKRFHEEIFFLATAIMDTNSRLGQHVELRNLLS